MRRTVSVSMDTSFENPEKNPTNVSFFSSLPANRCICRPACRHQIESDARNWAVSREDSNVKSIRQLKPSVTSLVTSLFRRIPVPLHTTLPRLRMLASSGLDCSLHGVFCGRAVFKNGPVRASEWAAIQNIRASLPPACERRPRF
jgi:hypothetical protein